MMGMVEFLFGGMKKQYTRVVVDENSKLTTATEYNLRNATYFSEGVDFIIYKKDSTKHTFENWLEHITESGTKIIREESIVKFAKELEKHMEVGDKLMDTAAQFVFTRVN